MLRIVWLFIWPMSKMLQWLAKIQEYFWPPVFAVLDITGCLLKFCIWIVIFTVSATLNLLGFCLLVLISIVSQIMSFFDRPPKLKKRSKVNVIKSRRPKSQDFPVTSNGHSFMDYDSIMRTTRGLYTWRGSYARPKLSCPDYWPLEYDSSYFTDSPRSLSERSFEQSWSPSRTRFRQPLL